MQVIYILLASFAIACVYVFLQKRNRNKNISDTQNPYHGLREQALLMRPEQLGLQLLENEEIAFGVIVELGMNGGSATTVAFATGDASLYTSRGGGIIGGGVSNKNVIAAAINLVTIAQKYFPKWPKSESLNTPTNGYVKFFILTNRGTYSVTEKEAAVTEPNSIWAELFNASNELIMNLRFASKKS